MTETTERPTVVLVHGAFADGGSWAGVVELLIAEGVPVQAVVNPLRGIAFDSAYVKSAIQQIPGTVLAVGHSYGGAVISNATTDLDNVKGLVYVAAFAPDEGEKLGDIEQGSTDSVLNSNVQPAQFPADSGEATELYVQPTAFPQVFAADLPAPQAAVLAASQRPVAASAFDETSGPPAWKKLPSWAVVATGDKAAGSDVVLMMAKRAKADIVEVEGSHVIMISQPRKVVDVILKALKAIS